MKSRINSKTAIVGTPGTHSESLHCKGAKRIVADVGVRRCKTACHTEVSIAVTVVIIISSLVMITRSLSRQHLIVTIIT